MVVVIVVAAAYAAGVGRLLSSSAHLAVSKTEATAFQKWTAQTREIHFAPSDGMAIKAVMIIMMMTAVSGDLQPKEDFRTCGA
jgi:hypothetical protein